MKITEQYIIDKKQLDFIPYDNMVLVNLRVLDIQVLHCIEEIVEITEVFLTNDYYNMLIEIVDLYGLYMLILNKRFTSMSKIKPLVTDNGQFIMHTLHYQHMLTSYMRKRQRYNLEFQDLVKYLRDYLGMSISKLSENVNFDYYKVQTLIKRLALLQFVARPMNYAKDDTEFDIHDYNFVRSNAERLIPSFGKGWNHFLTTILSEEKFYVSRT